MDANDITKDMLIAVAEDLTHAMGLEPEIDTNETEEVIKADIIESADELIENDVVTKETQKILVMLGIQLPWPIRLVKGVSAELPKAIEPKAIEIGEVKEVKEVKETQVTKKPGVGSFIMDGLIAGAFEGFKNKDIARLAVEKFGGKTTVGCIGWYKNKLKKENTEFIK